MDRDERPAQAFDLMLAMAEKTQRLATDRLNVLVENDSLAEDIVRYLHEAEDHLVEGLAALSALLGALGRNPTSEARMAHLHDRATRLFQLVEEIVQIHLFQYLLASQKILDGGSGDASEHEGDGN